MIICRTPYRVSFFGGGTDYPGWYRRHGGAVLASTIDKYCYLTCRRLPPFFDHRIRVVYRKIETCRTLDEVSHPTVRETMRYLGIDRGVELHHDGDLPARSGMGSSSAFTVSLLNALHALKGELATKAQLAREAIHIEQDVLGETVGSQDQVLAAHGGLRHVRFHPDGEIEVSPVILPPGRLAELKSYLLLVYTGIARTAADVARSYVPSLDAKRRQLRLMKDFVDEAIGVLTGGVNLVPIGELLHEAWMAKRSLSPIVSNPEVDDLYERARSAGAIGGKLTGAGGGGFLLLFAPPERHADILAALDDRIHVPFEFDTGGSQIIFYEPGTDYADAERARDRRRPFTEFRPEPAEAA
ncbi:GHMP family kinase ATP-binding protein [Urbifossiella limnaea]|uniref:D-glycero-alpha-D-manno-heptose 7-phosphate kinase n=1 Tax=Urbifossiella limnaea TaxID=2528023 RepID=A0A517XQ05_9BACT|nr:kinase [Urbifossiella limnaea]QDU19595.1 D-glycero-alpha-D-manno-heptose 7-phosphate kinase [Urbifossiella limnaea]